MFIWQTPTRFHVIWLFYESYGNRSKNRQIEEAMLTSGMLQRLQRWCLSWTFESPLAEWALAAQTFFFYLYLDWGAGGTWWSASISSAASVRFSFLRWPQQWALNATYSATARSSWVFLLSTIAAGCRCLSVLSTLAVWVNSYVVCLVGLGRTCVSRLCYVPVRLREVCRHLSPS